jgi:hypothetical protein
MMLTLESLSKANFTILCFNQADCEIIWIMCKEQGLPRSYEAMKIRILTFLSLHYRISCRKRDSKCFDAYVEPENRMSLLGAPRSTLRKTLVHRPELMSIFIADENVFPLFDVLKSKGPAQERFFQKASQVYESGIFHRVTELDDVFRKTSNEIGPQVLTLEHLRAGFVVFMAFLGLSFAVFLFELAPRLQPYLKKWLEMCMVCYIVVKFVETNRLI